MKLLSRLVIALLICLIAIPILAVPAQAYEEEISLHPSSGCVGKEVYIRGYNFSTSYDYWVYYEKDSSWVEVLDRYDCDVESDGDFSTEKFSIPESCAGEHKIRVCNDDDYHDYVAWEYFTVEPKVEITSPTSAEGHVGDTIKVKGTGFGKSEDVEVWYYLDSTHHTNSVSARANTYGTWEKTFRVPASVKGSHKIVADGEDNDYHDVEEDSFTVEPKISLDKASAGVGDTITISGSGFKKNEASIKITFAGDEVTQTSEADTDEYGSWTAKVEVPPCSKGNYKIDARGRYTTYTEVGDVTISVGPGMVIEPTEGHVGTSITVSGSGFVASKRVTITYDGSEMKSDTTDATGSFSGISFKTPKSKHGNHVVNATDAQGNSVTANFSMESTPPPTPTLISPANESRVGFIGKVTPTFEWSNVTDPSGVSYNLQIATSENFTEPSAFTGLSAANYTLPKEEALSHGSYYWRVKAIDGAQNAGNWSESYSFKSGRLPLWAFIAIVVLVVGLIGGLIYFFVGRRRRYYG